MSAQSSSPRFSRRRKILIAVAAVVGVLVVAYFVVTGNAFLQRFVLPKVAEATNAEVTADHISAGLFSGVRIDGLQITPKGAQELMRVDEIVVKPKLAKLMAGTIGLNLVELRNPRVEIVRYASGEDSLSSWLRGFESDEPSDPTEPPPALDIDTISISGGVFVLRDESTAETRVLTVDGFTLDVANLANNRDGTVTLDVPVRWQQPGAGGAEQFVEAGLRGDVQVRLNDDLLPETLTAALRFAVGSASEEFRHLREVAVDLSANVSDGTLRDAGLQLTQSGETLTALTANGALDLAALDGELAVSLEGLPTRLISGIAMEQGVTLDDAELVSTNTVQFVGGALERVEGAFRLGGLTVQTDAGQTPVLDLASTYSVRLTEAAIHLDAFQFSGSAAGETIATGGITSPLAVARTGNAAELPDGSLEFNVTELDLEPWRPLLGNAVQAGRLGLTLNAVTSNQGRRVEMNGTGDLTGLAMDLGGSPVTGMDVQWNLAGSLEDAELVTVDELQVTTMFDSAEASVLQGSSTMNLASGEGNATSEMFVNLPAWNPLLADGSTRLTGGAFSMTSTTRMRSDGMESSARIAVTNLSAQLPSGDLAPMTFSADVSASQDADGMTATVENGLIQAGNGSPGRLTAAVNVPSSGDRPDARLRLEALPADLLNLFAGLGGVEARVESGTLDVDFQSAAGGGSDALPLSGSLVARELRLAASPTNQVSEPLTLRVDLGASWNESTRVATLEHLDLRPGSDTNTTAVINSRGQVDLDTGAADFSLTIVDLNEGLLTPQSVLWFGDPLLEQGRIDGEVRLRHDPEGDSDFSSRLTFDGLRLARTNTPVPESISVDLAATLSNGRFDIREGDFSWTPNERATNAFTLAGWFDAADASALGGEIALTGDSIDLTGLMALQPAGTAAPEEAMPEPADEPVQLPESFPVREIIGTIDFGKIYLRDLELSDVKSGLRITATEARLDPLSLAVNGAPVRGRGEFRAGPQAGYDLQLETQELPVRPFVAAFMPDWRGEASALLSTTVNLSGKNFDPAQPLAGLEGTIHFGATNANLRLGNTTWQPVLNGIETLLRTPKIFEEPVQWAYFGGTITNGVLDIDALSIVSDAFVANAKGRFAVVPAQASNGVGRLPINLYLNREVGEGIRLFQREDDAIEATKYQKLPTFVHVTGSLSKLEFDVNRLAITSLLAGSAGDLVGGSAGNVLRGAGNVVDGIGGLLSGRTIKQAAGGEDEAAAGGVGEGVEKLFGGIGNILGSGGNAVEKQTGNLTGREQVEEGEEEDFIRAFDWPRLFLGEE